MSAVIAVILGTLLAAAAGHEIKQGRFAWAGYLAFLSLCNLGLMLVLVLREAA